MSDDEKRAFSLIQRLNTIRKEKVKIKYKNFFLNFILKNFNRVN
jgi:hypothetical protein